MFLPKTGKFEGRRNFPDIPFDIRRKYEKKKFPDKIDSPEKWRKFIEDVTSFLNQSTREDDYAERIEALLLWINSDLTGGYDCGYDAKEKVLTELLSEFKFEVRRNMPDIPFDIRRKYEEREFPDKLYFPNEWREFIEDVTSFLNLSTGEENYAERIEALLLWINSDLTGGYDCGYDAKENVLKELLKRRFRLKLENKLPKNNKE